MGTPKIHYNMKLLHLVTLALCALAVSSLPSDGDILLEQEFVETPNAELVELRNTVAHLADKISKMDASLDTSAPATGLKQESQDFNEAPPADLIEEAPVEPPEEAPVEPPEEAPASCTEVHIGKFRNKGSQAQFSKSTPDFSTRRGFNWKFPKTMRVAVSGISDDMQCGFKRVCENKECTEGALTSMVVNWPAADNKNENCKNSLCWKTGECKSSAATYDTAAAQPAGTVNGATCQAQPNTFVIQKSNWNSKTKVAYQRSLQPSSNRYADKSNGVFKVTITPGEVVVTRVDARKSWGGHLQFTCCSV